jgi:hypothetical protein
MGRDQVLWPLVRELAQALVRVQVPAWVPVPAKVPVPVLELELVLELVLVLELARVQVHGPVLGPVRVLRRA